MMIFFVSVGCSNNRSVARSRWNFGSPQSFTRELSFNEKGRTFSQVALEIDISLSGGSVAWEAYAPNGDLLFKSSTQNKYRDTIKLDPVPGEWKLVVIATDAVGSMEFFWQGRK